MNSFLKPYCMLLLLIFSFSVKAVPFHIDDQSAYQGSSVTLSLVDELTNNLEAATLRINYDPTLLSFSSIALGSVISAFDALTFDNSASGIVDVSLATFSGSPVNLETGSLLSVTFNIFNNAALGNTNVSIECLNWDTANLTPCTAPTSTAVFNDYYVPNTVGKVTILEQTTTVPEPDIIMLLLTGLFVFSVLLKRKQVA